MSHIYVINSLGEREPISYYKIYRSARRVGAAKKLARQIADKIIKEAKSGITTKEIYQKVQEQLRIAQPVAALRFSLKEGIKKLGPAGFMFEKYMAKVFESYGYFVQLNQFINGFCLAYEIDFLAQKNKEIILAECKYHNLSGGRVDLKVALADYARYLDLADGNFLKRYEQKKFKIRKYIITNTKFTSEVIKYAHCVGIELLGWRYPPEGGLEALIENKKLYPITVLPSLNGHFAEILSQEHKVLIQDIIQLDAKKLARRYSLNEKQFQKLKEEAGLLLQNSDKDEH